MLMSAADFRFANLFGVARKALNCRGKLVANLTVPHFGGELCVQCGVHQADMDLTNSVVQIAEPVPHPWALAKPVAPLQRTRVMASQPRISFERTSLANRRGDVWCGFV